MKCPKCQFENIDESTFCGECGSSLELDLTCPNCGEKPPQAYKFCNKCGYDLREPQEEIQRPPAIDYKRPQSYTPKFLVDKILTSKSSIEGERKLVTVLFADVASYTSMAEILDPEEVHQIMDGCFKIFMDKIHGYEGTINQFTGDGVMALFGAPVAHEDHGHRACRAALAIQKAMGDYQERLEKDYGVQFKIRIGLNSGPVIVGSIGDDLRMDYTAVGDTTNLASRMEGIASPGTTIVSENTHKLVKDFFEFESLGKVPVKGKEKEQQVYELTKQSKVETRIDAAVAKGLTEFVGRTNSMAALKGSLEKAESGEGQVVGLVGEAGVGKSRLLFELKKELPKDRYTYLEGRCLHFGGSMAYLPILDILRLYFEIREGDREFIIKKKMTEKIVDLDEKLHGYLPCFQELLSLKVDEEEYLKLEPMQKRERIFEAIRDLLIRESQERPLVLAIEDLHWIDKTSEEFLDYLIGWISNSPFLLILLYRPEYTHPWGSKSYYNRIGLNQLTTKSSVELVQAILEGGEVVPEIRELILSRTGGNPLFMEEFTRSLLENGTIQKEDHQYVLSTKASEIRVPDTIQGIIAARMDRLEDNLKRTMQVAAVIGRDFAFRILQSVTGMSEELKSYLLNLQGLEFIYEKRLFPELEYIFKHALTQEVAYNSLLLKRRKDIHQEIGEAIEKIYPERLEEFYEMLAYHYSKGGDSEKAYSYLRLSGDKATRSHSLWEAFHFYREAIDLLKQLPKTNENKKEQIEVRLSLSNPMHLLDYPEDSVEILQEGEKLSKESGDERSLLILRSKLGSYYANHGDPLSAVKYTENSFHEAKKTQDIELIAPTACELCNAYLYASEFSKLIDVAYKVLSLLEKSQRERDFFGTRYNVYSGLCALSVIAAGWLGEFQEGEVLYKKGLHFALDVHSLYALGLLELGHGQCLSLLGDGEKAAEHSQKCVNYYEEAQAVLGLGLAWAQVGYGYYLLGDLKKAKDFTEKGIKIHTDAGPPSWLSFQFWLLGIVHFDQGDLKNAQSFMDKALELSEKNNERHWEGVLRIWLGRILGIVAPSDADNAEEYIFHGIKICDELKTRPFSAQGRLFLGELYSDIGQKEKALKNLRRAEEMFQEMGMDYWLIKVQGAVERL
jgi:class 3 adenylate cyclase/tetratricopeptide (TPR) repeat protein